MNNNENDNNNDGQIVDHEGQQNLINVEDAANDNQKKRRGRPKGSKNKPKVIQEVACTIRSPVEHTASNRPQRKVAKRPTDTLFIIKPKPGSKCYYSTEITVDYTPHKEQDHSERQSIIPKLNTDNKPHVPGFVMEMDRNYYEKHDSRYKEEHKNKIADYTKPKSRLYQPKPGKRHNYCCVCKQSYDDYLDHVISAIHKKHYNNNEFSKLIKGINVEYSVRMQQAKQQETSDILCDTYTQQPDLIDDDLVLLTDNSNTFKQYNIGKSHQQQQQILDKQQQYNQQQQQSLFHLQQQQSQLSNSNPMIQLGQSAQQQQQHAQPMLQGLANSSINRLAAPMTGSTGTSGFSSDLYNNALARNAAYLSLHPDYQQASSVFLQNKVKPNAYGYSLDLGQNPHLSTSQTCIGLTSKQTSSTNGQNVPMGISNAQQQQQSSQQQQQQSATAQQQGGFTQPLYQQLGQPPFFLNFSLPMTSSGGNNNNNNTNGNIDKTDLMIMNQPSQTQAQQQPQQQQTEIINLNHSHHSYLNTNNNNNNAANLVPSTANNNNNLNLSNHASSGNNNNKTSNSGINQLNAKRTAESSMLFCEALENPRKQQFIYQPSNHSTKIFDLTGNEQASSNNNNINTSTNNTNNQPLPTIQVNNPVPSGFLRCAPSGFLI